MIHFENVSKRFKLRSGEKRILKDATFTIQRGKSLGVLGVNGAGKSTLLRMISGKELPDRGRVTRENVTVSWPLGFADSFHGSLTGLENLRFACRIYEKNFTKVSQYVDEFADLGAHIEMPVKTYSSGMKARLAFGLSMAFNFDIYLVDEITAVGDATFQAKSRQAFTEKLKNSDIIMVSHNMNTLRRYCTTGCILNKGGIQFFDRIDDAITAYGELTKEKV
jgi:capsular polysaccharide transport system ATP-binding protein